MMIPLYFQHPTLLANFKAALETAESELELSLVEAQWLRRLADEAVVPESMRIEAVVNAQPLSNACLLIHQRDPQLQAVYLYSPLLGVRGYDNLPQLQSALSAELAHLQIPGQALQFLELDAPVFEQWSQRLLQQQIDMLEGQFVSLGKLPTLRGIVDDCLKTRFASLMEGIDDIPGRRLQVVTATDQRVVRTETLSDAALQVFSGEPLGIGLQRRFLRGDSDTFNDAYDTICQRALSATTPMIPGVFANLLREYWNGADNDLGNDRRESLALCLADNYVRALLRAASAKTVDTEQFEWLRQLLIPGTGTVDVCTLTFAPLASATDQRHGVHLADSLLIKHPEDTDKGVFLFTSSQGFKHFADHGSLKQHCLAQATASKRPHCIAQDDWDQLQLEAPVDILLSVTEQGPFLALADALIALINRRLAHALRYPGAQRSTAGAVVEDALDIRALIDGRLTQLANTSLWSSSTVPATSRHFTPLPSQSDTLLEQVTHARALSSLMKGINTAQPTLKMSVNELLAAFVTTLSDGQWQPTDLQLVRGQQTQSIVDYYLERLRNTGPMPSPADARVQDPRGKVMPWPDAKLVQEQVETLTANFSNYYLNRLKAFDEGPQRRDPGLFFIPGLVDTLYQALLRLDLALARRDQLIDADLLDLLQSALDRPGQSLADAEFRIRSLSLKIPGRPAILPLTCAFVLQRKAPGKESLLLWSPLEPLSQFDNEQRLFNEMDGAFEDEEKLYQWLDLVHPEDLLKWHTHSVLPGVTVPELGLSGSFTDLLGHIAKSELKYRASTRLYHLTNAIRSQFDAGLLERYVAREAQQRPFQKAVKRVLNTLENQYFQSLLPSWLRNATVQQMTTYSLLVQASAAVSQPKFNYLFDIPPIETFTRARLSEGLQREYPTAPSDPEQITLTFTHFTPNPVSTGTIPAPISSDIFTTTKSLTEFALTHDDPIGTVTTIKASVLHTDKAPEVLDAIKLRNLVDKLDVGGAYRAVLEDKLGANHPTYPERRRRYMQVASAYLMTEAYQRFLDKQLSLESVFYFSHVLIKPDALARDRALGKRINISHLQLRAAAGFAPDTVRGLYVIGPNDAESGPLVLYSAYRKENMLTEYKSAEALRAAILSDTAMQQDILSRLDDGVRIRYDHKGFLHPHLFWSSSDLFDFDTTPGPAQLVLSEIDGNALHYLYDENVALLKALAKARTVTTKEAYWKVFRYVLGLALEQSSFFLPGKLAALLGSLQGVQWLKASGGAALQHHWGESLAEFVTALATLASTRSPHIAISRKAQTIIASEPIVSEIDPGWNAVLQGSSLQERLSRLQARDVQLKDMVKNTTLDLYVDTSTSRYFAAVEGEVYEVSKPNEHWQIIKGNERGPQLKKADGHWKVDLREGLQGGGAALSVFDTAIVDNDVSSRYTALVSGMKNISALHPVKHAMLVRAYDKAGRYLVTCLENLNAATPSLPLPPRAQSILDISFGHPTSAATAELLRDYAKRILAELLSPSMSLASSKRIVVGLNMPDHRDTLAFVYTDDPGKRIFLTEQFFSLPWRLEAYATSSNEKLLAHQQAVTLIHELSHQTLKTVDIAYVEAKSPFTRLISRQTAEGQKLYDEIVDFRMNGLSASTNSLFLFKTRKNFAWRDLQHDDSRALDVIYRLTKTTDLPAAREAFYTDPQIRTDVIMANADSIALLISKLGRKRFAPAG